MKFHEVSTTVDTKSSLVYPRLKCFTFRPFSKSNIIFAKKILSVLPSVRRHPSPSPAHQKIALLQSFLSLQRYPLPPPRRG